MRRFQFRLERFLDLRRWKEREWEIRLAHATGKVIVLKNRIAEIGTEIGASYERSFTSAGAVDVDAMAGRELYVQRLAAERTRKTAELAVRTREMEEVRARYLEPGRGILRSPARRGVQDGRRPQHLAGAAGRSGSGLKGRGTWQSSAR